MDEIEAPTRAEKNKKRTIFTLVGKVTNVGESLEFLDWYHDEINQNLDLINIRIQRQHSIDLYRRDPQ